MVRKSPERTKPQWADSTVPSVELIAALSTSGYTAISRKVVGKMCTRESRKVTCIGYDKYTVTDTAAVEPTFVVFL